MYDIYIYMYDDRFWVSKPSASGGNAFWMILVEKNSNFRRRRQGSLFPMSESFRRVNVCLEIGIAISGIPIIAWMTVTRWTPQKCLRGLINSH